MAIPDDALRDLRERLARTRWPDAAPGGGWAQGTELGYLRELAEYWQTTFDWRKHEARLNALPQFRAKVEGEEIHFVHVRGKGAQALPLLISHGWPSSFVEFEKILPLLAEDFDVVIPSLPGYAFSARPTRTGMSKRQIAELWARLMTEHLGYPKFCAHGGDIGAGVTSHLGLWRADVVTAIHVMAVLTPWLGEGSAPLSAEEKRFQALIAEWEQDEGGYDHQQRTRPQSLAYGLNDSPAALAAWIVEKWRAWSDCGGEVGSVFSQDELLTNISLYWFTETGGSATRLYYDREHPAWAPDARTRVAVPTGVALTVEPVERAPRAWAERTYKNIQHWTEFPRGGHFMAAEQPELLAADLKKFFRRFR
jgi:pimeloyl-ACP methyl ester carboxylesterase